MKKLLFTLGALSAVAMPIAAVVSCGSGSKPGVTPPVKGTPGITGGQGGSDGSGAGGSAGTAGQTGQAGNTGTYLSVGAATNTLDLSDASIKRNIVVDKDGHILTWPNFVPVKSTRAKSRHPGDTDPHPITVPAEPFTRTTSPGAMDVTGWTPNYSEVAIETSKTPDEIKKMVQSKVDPLTTIDPITFDEFSHLDEILHGHLLVLDTYDSVSAIDITDSDLVSKIMTKLGIDVRSLGITILQGAITREVNTGIMLQQSIKTLTLRNVVFTLKGESTYLPIDIKILIG